jgi:hypothetical protein
MNVIHCCNATSSIALGSEPDQIGKGYPLNLSRDTVMKEILKVSLLSFGLMAGTAALAAAQSVSSLPPEAADQAQSGQTGQTAHTYPYGSTQSFYPKPGGSEVITEPTYQAPAAPAPSQAAQPYPGPKSN